MKEGKRILLSGFIFFTILCANAQQKVLLPEVSVSEDRVKSAPQYSGTTERRVDLLHMNLEIQPNMAQHTVSGQADVYLKPIFKEVDSVHLDAKQFKIYDVMMVLGGERVAAPYSYDGNMLHIALNKSYVKDEVFHLYINYLANPDSITGADGQAIRKGRGFYFIDSTADYSQSFWTQGEPESNSGWFPTIDKPFEKFTHQIGITVDTAWKTLSNGLLDFKTDNGNGTKTEYWVMDKPHAPYLVMVAGGIFDTVGTQWNDIRLNYFVEPKWKDRAAAIFEYTPEMLTLYSDLLGVPYMWQKYDQIVVRDFVSGAMENTTAVVHGTSVYRDERAQADRNSEYVIAHELFHQWFGDLVTCKTWGDLTLNEGFASYGEYLWFEYKYGKDELDWYLHKEWLEYLREYNRGKSETLIRLAYEDPQDMLDRHSYNKGGLTLHMLRTIVGDEAFFAALKNYLTTNAYKAVELSDLRKAFEETTGQDLRWFFDQWYLVAGHPKITVTHSFDREAGKAILTVKQTQDVHQFPVYRLPVAIDVYTQLGVKRYDVELSKQEQTFSFDVLSQPYLVKFDAENVLVADVEVVQSEGYWLHQLGNSKHVIDRYNSVNHVLETKNLNLLSTIAGIAMDDKFWAIQLEGLGSASRWDEAGKKKLKDTVKKLLDSENTSVRAKAIEVWSSVYKVEDLKLYNENLAYISYKVNSAALVALAQTDTKNAVAYALSGINAENAYWSAECADVVAKYGLAQDLETANQAFKTKSVRQRLVYIILLSQNVERGGAEGKKAVDILVDEIVNSESTVIKYYAQKLLEERILAMEESAKTAPSETASVLKEMVKYADAKLAEINPE